MHRGIYYCVEVAVKVGVCKRHKLLTWYLPPPSEQDRMGQLLRVPVAQTQQLEITSGIALRRSTARGLRRVLAAA